MGGKNRVAKAEPVQVPEVVSEDEQLTQTDGGQIVRWLGELRKFMGRAEALERAAVETLERARAWKLPTTAAEDEQLQREIKATTADQKEIEAHWTITAAISRFHRRLTAKRSIGVGALEEANRIGNGLHNQYTEAEKRRAAAADRIAREEAEFLAKQEREHELARLEAEAVVAEEAAPELSKRETDFVNLFCGTNAAYAGRAQACAIAASFKAGTSAEAAAVAARLMSNAKIQIAIKAQQQAAVIRRQAVAKAAAPVAVEYREVRPNITKAPGASDRTTWGGEVLNEAATIEAFRAGTHGIPADLFQINPAKLNEYGRSLHERLDLWPGVRHTKKTGVV